MTLSKICVALAPALILLGCSETQISQTEQQQDSSVPPATLPAQSPGDAATGKDASAPNDGRPDLAPPELTAEAERGEKGARNLLLSFARAIELGEFDHAWALLGPSDKNKWSRSQFAALFSDLSAITVAVPDGTTEGAAGSLYYTAPVAITGSDTDGRPVRMEGTAVLRRVNDVDGATAAQLRWHFETVTLDWTH